MALFKRKGPIPTSDQGSDLSTLILEGQDMIEQVGQAHTSRWGLGTATAWGFDQTTGVITWTFADRTASAAAQILGSYNAGAGSWLWAWANKGLLPSVRSSSDRFRSWAQENGHRGLTEAKIECNAEVAATMAAIAFRVTHATGFYRAPAGASDVFFTFGPVTITDSDGSSSTFTISLD
ncbi:MAG TPA: hypothetical protein VF557_14375 [Jatrophihabitans sp.]|jgi:hypothetical protein|uniref:DUF6882 domain-containing protein n=1 Tax=Jatrophihabitans sp. TaxID=1932789 RepID=UPI002EE6FF83